MFVVNKKRFSVRHFDEYKKQLLTAQQEALNILLAALWKKNLPILEFEDVFKDGIFRDPVNSALYPLLKFDNFS